ncbi:hypothetical protein C8Q80DRAFT_348648 [Daedaleopsis nitida]|nr:hypothetical protein C8Q80DRAFT_348648 [Daedaleopsis nitida]
MQSSTGHHGCAALLPDNCTRCSSRLLPGKRACVAHIAEYDALYQQYKDAASVADALHVAAQIKQSDVRALPRAEVDSRIEDVDAYLRALLSEKTLREEHSRRFMVIPDQGHRTRLERIEKRMTHGRNLLQTLHGRKRHFSLRGQRPGESKVTNPVRAATPRVAQTVENAGLHQRSRGRSHGQGRGVDGPEARPSQRRRRDIAVTGRVEDRRNKGRHGRQERERESHLRVIQLGEMGMHIVASTSLKVMSPPSDVESLPATAAADPQTFVEVMESGEEEKPDHSEVGWVAEGSGEVELEGGVCLCASPSGEPRDIEQVFDQPDGATESQATTEIEIVEPFERRECVRTPSAIYIQHTAHVELLPATATAAPQTCLEVIESGEEARPEDSEVEWVAEGAGELELEGGVCLCSSPSGELRDIEQALGEPSSSSAGNIIRNKH